MATLVRSFEEIADPENDEFDLLGHASGGGQPTVADEIIWNELSDEQQASIIRLVRSFFGDVEERIQEAKEDSYKRGSDDAYEDAYEDGLRDGAEKVPGDVLRLKSVLRDLLEI